MAQQMQLPMRTISTKQAAAPMTVMGFFAFHMFSAVLPVSFFFLAACMCHIFFPDELEAKHRLALLRLAWLVWHYGIPPALMVSQDQSCILLFTRRGKRCAEKGADG